MKLLILGATGNTGKQLVEQALEQCHEVTVLVRKPAKLGALAARGCAKPGSCHQGRILQLLPYRHV